MKFFLDNIELILSFLGIVVIFAVPMLFFGDSVIWWEVAAITAIFVGVFHGFIFWIVRRKQRRIRQEAIEEIRKMLKDKVNNQLSVISLSASGLSVEQIKNLSDSINQISYLIGTLSDESITDWRRKYSETLESFGSN